MSSFERDEGLGSQVMTVDPGAKTRREEGRRGSLIGIGWTELLNQAMIKRPPPSLRVPQPAHSSPPLSYRATIHIDE
jgi:hypothetical protein